MVRPLIPLGNPTSYVTSLTAIASLIAALAFVSPVGAQSSPDINVRVDAALVRFERLFVGEELPTPREYEAFVVKQGANQLVGIVKGMIADWNDEGLKELDSESRAAARLIEKIEVSRDASGEELRQLLHQFNREHADAEHNIEQSLAGVRAVKDGIRSTYIVGGFLTGFPIIYEEIELPLIKAYYRDLPRVRKSLSRLNWAIKWKRREIENVIRRKTGSNKPGTPDTTDPSSETAPDRIGMSRDDFAALALDLWSRAKKVQERRYALRSETIPQQDDEAVMEVDGLNTRLKEIDANLQNIDAMISQIDEIREELDNGDQREQLWSVKIQWRSLRHEYERLRSDIKLRQLDVKSAHARPRRDAGMGDRGHGRGEVTTDHPANGNLVRPESGVAKSNTRGSRPTDPAPSTISNEAWEALRERNELRRAFLQRRLAESARDYYRRSRSSQDARHVRESEVRTYLQAYSSELRTELADRLAASRVSEEDFARELEAFEEKSIAEMTGMHELAEDRRAELRRNFTIWAQQEQKRFSRSLAFAPPESNRSEAGATNFRVPDMPIVADKSLEGAGAVSQTPSDNKGEPSDKPSESPKRQPEREPGSESNPPFDALPPEGTVSPPSPTNEQNPNNYKKPTGLRSKDQPNRPSTPGKGDGLSPSPDQPIRPGSPPNCDPDDQECQKEYFKWLRDFPVGDSRRILNDYLEYERSGSPFPELAENRNRTFREAIFAQQTSSE